MIAILVIVIAITVLVIIIIIVVERDKQKVSPEKQVDEKKEKPVDEKQCMQWWKQKLWQVVWPQYLVITTQAQQEKLTHF